MRCKLWAAAAVLGLASAARAGQPIVWTETTTSGPPETVEVTGSRLVRLTDDVILGRGQAAPLAGRDVVATLDYAGVANALQLTLPADRSSATLAYPRSGGPVNTFSTAGLQLFESPAQYIDDSVYYTITDPHNQQWRNLQRLLNRESYITPADGNPSAATSFLADQTFRKYGLFSDASPDGEIARSRLRPAGADVWVDTLDGGFSTNGFHGYDLRFAVNADWRFSPYVGVSASIPIQYRDVDGADSYTVAGEVGLPVDVLKLHLKHDARLDWTVTPFVEFGVNDSRDLGSTVGLFGAGVASRLAYRAGPWTVTLANQFSGYTDLGADYGGDNGFGGDDGYYGGGNYDAFRGDVAQQMFKTGVQVARRFGRQVSVDGSLTYTTLVHNAAVDGYFTPRIGVTWQLDRLLGLRLAYQADLANHYQGQGGDLTAEFRF